MNDRVGIVLLLAAVVNGSLLFVSGWICKCQPLLWRSAAATMIGAVYTALCLEPGMVFLGAAHWRLLLLLMVGWVGFGYQPKRILVFLLLSLGLDILSSGIGRGGIWEVLPFAVIGLVFYIWYGRASGVTVSYVPVEVQFGEKFLRVTALRDTGNMLRDPISGTPVLILDADASEELTGLSAEQLQRPIEVMRDAPIPGLRLIPYKTIGQSSGMILGVWVRSVQIGNWKGSLTVAFAPAKFSGEGKFQALTGGTV